MNATEWHIRPASAACGGCERAFEDGESFISRLQFDAEGEYRRDDYCPACWLDGYKTESLSAWHTVYRAPAPPPPEAVGRETAESLLRSFMESGDPSHGDAVFVLAVMLERRRLLVERDVQHRDDGSCLRIYEHRGTGETFMVVDPQLRLNALEQVQARVVELLGASSTSKDSTASDPVAPPAAG